MDLAGSERVRRTTSSGVRLEEAKAINLSLSALSNVITALRSETQAFVPFRSSKLTRVLQNSLSGISKIVLLSTIGPSPKNANETLSTLQFANRCKDLICTPLANVVVDDEIEYGECNHLRKELAQL